MTSLTKQNQNAVAIQSQELQGRLNEVKDNLKSVENARLPKTKLTSLGFELSEGAPTQLELVGTIIHTKRTNVYYAKPFNPTETQGPDCFSLDSSKPDSSIANPQSQVCSTCAQAKFGSNSMKSGKACRNLKPIYLLLGDDSIIPRELVVTPTSLRAANNYLMELTERGLSYRKVKTKITAYKENSKDTYMKLKFTFMEKLTEQRAADVESIKSYWLSAMDSQSIEDTATGASASSEEIPF